MTKKSTARDKALHLLRSLITKNTASGNYFLPSLNHLALEAGVSRMTMWHAVHALQDQGILRSVGSRGTAITATLAPPPADHPKPDDTDDSLEARIGRAIAGGTYRTGTPFPRIKELCATHGVSYPRMRAALERLVHEGLLLRGERRYSVADTAPSPLHSTLIFIAATDRMMVLTDTTPRSIEFWRVLEQETASRRINLVVMSHVNAVKLFLPKPGAETLPATFDGNPVLGFVCWDIALDNDAIAQLGTMATATGRPLVLFNESGILRMPATMSANRLCRTFPMYGTRRAGTIMGAFLITGGYRHVAYVTNDVHGESPRFEGLAAAYRAAGLSDAVTFFAPEHPPDARTTTGRIEQSLSDEACGLVIDMMQQHNIAIVNDDKDQLGIWNNRFIGHIDLRAQLAPMFDRILDEKKHDIIVGYNDEVAIMALEHLHSRGVAVPRSMGVTGFDDTVNAIGRGLTSYNWNTAHAVHAMLQFILRPAEFNRLFRREGVEVEVDGRVMARGTTRSR